MAVAVELGVALALTLALELALCALSLSHLLKYWLRLLAGAGAARAGPRQLTAAMRSLRDILKESKG